MDKELEEAIKRIKTSLERPGILGIMRKKDLEIILNYVKNSTPNQEVNK